MTKLNQLLAPIVSALEGGANYLAACDPYAMRAIITEVGHQQHLVAAAEQKAADLAEEVQFLKHHCRREDIARADEVLKRHRFKKAHERKQMP
jgi:hypothetical protein